MARAHHFYFLLNDEGQPIENATVNVYLAGTTTPAKIFHQESGGSVNETGQLLTTGTGYFEFWIADESESNGYARTQKFKIKWEKTGVASGYIDYVDVFSLGYDELDPTDTSTAKNKVLSNYQGYLWETHRSSTITVGSSASNPHGLTLLNEDDMASNSENAVATQKSIKSYVDNTLSDVIYSTENSDVDSPAETIDSFTPTSSENGCIWFFVVKKVGNVRAGTMTAAWYTTTGDVQYSEVATTDIGVTSDVVLSVDYSGGQIRLRATVASDNWQIQVKRIII